MDPIFDRLGRLIRSFGVDTRDHTSSRSSDPLEREAEEELEEFLRTGRNEPRRPTQGQKSYQEQRRQESHQEAAPPPEPALVQALATLGLAPGATWDQINAAHRLLLKKHHPDSHAGNEDKMKQATAQSQKINEAYQFLKKHFGR